VELAAALCADVSDDLPEDGAEDAVDKRKLQGVDQRPGEILVSENAGYALHDAGISGAHPVVGCEVRQRVDPVFEHEALQHQNRDGSDNAHHEEYEQGDGDDRLLLAQTDGSGAPALASDGGIGLSGADHPLVNKYRQGSDGDHHDGHGECCLGILGFAVHVQLTGQRHEIDLGS